jgi:hypothetical protein
VRILPTSNPVWFDFVVLLWSDIARCAASVAVGFECACERLTLIFDTFFRIHSRVPLLSSNNLIAALRHRARDTQQTLSSEGRLNWSLPHAKMCAIITFQPS